MTTVYLWQYFTCTRKWEGRARQSDVNNSWLVESNLIQMDSPWPDLIRMNIRAGPFCNCDHRKALKIINVVVNLRAVTSVSRPLLPCSLSSPLVSLILEAHGVQHSELVSGAAEAGVSPRNFLGTREAPISGTEAYFSVSFLNSLFMFFLPSVLTLFVRYFPFFFFEGIEALDRPKSSGVL